MEISRNNGSVELVLERGPGAPNDEKGALDETKALTIIRKTANIMPQGRREDNILTIEHDDSRTTLDAWTEQITASDRLSMNSEQFHALTSLAHIAVVSCHVVPKEAIVHPNNAAAARVIHALDETYVEATGRGNGAWGKR